MTDDRDNQEPLSSEELIRRAREGFSTDSDEAAVAADSAGDTTPEETSPEDAPGASDADSHETTGAPDLEDRAVDEPSRQTDIEQAHPEPVAPPPPPNFETLPDLGSDVEEEPSEQDLPPLPPDTSWPPPDLPEAGGSLPSPPPSGASRLFAAGRWIVGGILLFLFLGQCAGSGTTLDDLDIGDCFENPGVGDEVSEVDTVDCGELHDFELYARVTLGTSDDDLFPGSERLFAELEGECVALFPSYVGHDYLTSVYDFVAFTPVESGWRDGDRTGMCALYEFDGAFNVIETSGTARNSGR